MLHCVRRNLQNAVTTLVTVLLIYSRTVEPTAEPNTSYSQETLTHGQQPRVLALVKPCRLDQTDYCIHGKCFYTPDLNTTSCKCDPTFSGERCQHVQLGTLSSSHPEEIIGVTCGVLLLLGCSIILCYICYKKRCWKSSPPYKNYGHENSANSVNTV